MNVRQIIPAQPNTWVFYTDPCLGEDSNPIGGISFDRVAYYALDEDGWVFAVPANWATDLEEWIRDVGTEVTVITATDSRKAAEAYQRGTRPQRLEDFV